MTRFSNVQISNVFILGGGDAPVAGAAITDAGDELYEDGEINIIITGSAFGAAQGTGNVYISSAIVRGGTSIEQTVTAWADDSITITAVKSSLAGFDGLYLTVLNDDTNLSNDWDVQFYTSSPSGALLPALVAEFSPSGPSWSNPSNVQLSDGNYANITQTLSSDSANLDAQNFPNLIIAGSTIVGIRVTAYVWVSTLTNMYMSMNFWNGSSGNGDGAKSVTSQIVSPSTWTEVSAGGSTDNWGGFSSGISLLDFINNVNTSLTTLQASNSGDSSVEYRVDWIKREVWFT